MPSHSVTTLRPASKNERRYIMRHALGWYRSLILAGLYTVDKCITFDATNVNSYVPALKWCINAHPILSTTIRGEESEAPEFVRPARLDLRNHVHIIHTASASYGTLDELELMKKITLEAHDKPWSDIESIPQWRIVVLTLPDQIDTRWKKLYIIFAYSHTHGDGKSGLAFHRSFLQGLQKAGRHYDDHPIWNTSQASIAPPLEESCDLKVSWSYLLSPLLGQHLPGFICRWLKLRNSPMTRSSHTYTGEPIRYASNTFQTGLQVLVVPKDLLDTVLAACRKQKGRLTGLLNQLVVRALSESLPQEMGFDSFTGQIVIDLRPLVPDYSDNMMGNYVSAICDISPRIGAEADYDHTFWEAVRNTTFQLADAVSTLEDQPIGLLKYLNNFRSWFLNQIGKDRDLSYEISNVGVFDPSVRGECGDVVPSTPEGQIRWKIERIMFSQPANVTGAPLNFQAATMKDADLVITLNWQIGVLGVQDEDTLTRTILNKIQGFMDEIAMKYASPYS